MREGSVKNKTISGNVFTPTVEKFNRLTSRLKFDKDGRIPFTFDNAKVAFGKDGCGDVLASSYKTRRNSDFSVINRKIRSGWRICKFESINEDKANQDARVYLEKVKVYEQDLNSLLNIFKNRFNDDFEILKEEFKKLRSEENSIVNGTFDCISMGIGVVDLYTATLALPLVGVFELTGELSAFVFVPLSLSCIAGVLVILIVSAVLKPIIDHRLTLKKKYGKEGIKIFKNLSAEIDRNRKKMENTLKELKKFTVEFKKIGKNGEIFLEKAKKEVKEYLSNKKIGRNTAALDICKIEYFRIIEKVLCY